MHPRRAIREALKDRLMNATLAEDRVFSTMTPPISVESTLQDEGPIIMVYARAEEAPETPIDRFEDSAQRRTLAIEVEALALGAGNIDNTLDDLSEQIEGLLEGFEIPGFPAAEIDLQETQIDVTDQFERVLGGIFMTYHVRYWKKWRAPLDYPDVNSTNPDGDAEGGGKGNPFIHGIDVSA